MKLNRKILPIALLGLCGILLTPQIKACSAHDFHKCAHGIDTTNVSDPLKCPNGICVEFSWKEGADLDIHAQLPSGAGAYIGSEIV